MPHARRRLGDRGEQLAVTFLRERGYTVLEQNYRCPDGEVDLVCRDGNELAFIEVKTRRGTMFGVPEEAVTPAKLAHVVAAAGHYLSEHDLESQAWRVDVVAIQLDTAGRLQEVRLIPNAADW
ncbi:MAG: YraN family protein [Chloroflexi bacterium]|nr:YraN family protein [Chloroflexota bacterium]